MRIFVLLSRIPYPLEKGDKLRAFNQIKGLSKNNEIILCALNSIRKIDKQQAFAELQPYCRSINFIDIPLWVRITNVIKAYFSGLPIQAGYFYSRKAKKKIKSLIQEYKPDHLFGQLVRVAPYLTDTGIPKTLDYQDAFSYGMKRRMEHALFPAKAVLKMEYKRLARFENRVFDVFDNKTIISEQDRNLISHPKKQEIQIVRNGVDFDFFSPKSSERKQDIVFCGNMNYPPNVDAALFLVKEIMPLVWKQKPETSLLLAGANPNRKVKKLADEKVRVSGWMEDIREAYLTSKIFIAPMRIGTGLQNKLLEAMSLKIPSVTTPLANAALHAKPDNEILIGETAGQLAENVISLLESEEKQNEIAENAFQFVHENFSWEDTTLLLEEVIKNGKSIGKYSKTLSVKEF
ncbi:MAG: glycosyltransferase [Bacteroidales bacterium]|nr:glycosyltransferase [Bacteroidales bacterium]